MDVVNDGDVLTKRETPMPHFIKWVAGIVGILCVEGRYSLFYIFSSLIFIPCRIACGLS